MNERDITINDRQWSQITNKINEAKSKGVTDSLVVLKDSALVVSNKNNTVITALNKDESNDHIFTNINGTIILDQ
ncbi:TIGR02530 family flagellar biosynthesis protein [Halobacillus sp. B23F22_1]|uniref:TIGR02530 family flagellar biosynthesis protein n=1 Tax=Halobacillus sp. B23F22_1 TaxID=3459514 RepID=UPI00373F70E2